MIWVKVSVVSLRFVESSKMPDRLRSGAKWMICYYETFCHTFPSLEELKCVYGQSHVSEPTANAGIGSALEALGLNDYGSIDLHAFSAVGPWSSNDPSLSRTDISYLCAGCLATYSRCGCTRLVSHFSQTLKLWAGSATHVENVYLMSLSLWSSLSLT